ncbi:MAG: hypothetical protein LH605_06310, partial [Microbacteriaceae bacterium]|nr:hypothetical protein [Microbacteriaceae bacterium]
MHDRVTRRAARGIVAILTAASVSFGVSACQSDFLSATGEWRSAVSPSPSVSASPEAPDQTPD